MPSRRRPAAATGAPVRAPLRLSLVASVRFLVRSGGGALVLCLSMAAASPALAHTADGHAASFAAGLAHPFTGLDHVLAMLAVGLWAGSNGGRAAWAWPVTFVGTMLVGGALPMTGVALPAVEPGILASVIVLGALVTTALRAPLAVGALVVAAFALLHGHAHGTELPVASSAVAYGAGFALATAVLHAAGLGIAVVSSRDADGTPMLVRGAGALVAVLGIALAIT